ncbi:hypothetical protein PILCRDRAFT_518 [Piloderma croceum F 1598]|uniref:Uncharacterized protein n=1 Tax=Piloderma croceum (strain F 1598) TaxID=765440 RepID=A0A0C3GL31_PILCF|nr:hypothetical protein PILCRDRAFT_518 [Piloderma croceum F 1598]
MIPGVLSWSSNIKLLFHPDSVSIPNSRLLHSSFECNSSSGSPATVAGVHRSSRPSTDTY